MNIQCICCRQMLDERCFFKSAQKKFRRGRIKAALCMKCHRAVKKKALRKAEQKLGRATTDKNRRRLERRVEKLRYVVIVRPKLQSAKRRARLLQARPTWVRAEWFDDIYSECARRDRETGIKHHVDHIVPLQGKHVCGLDVPWNLQVLTASENCAKSNKF